MTLIRISFSLSNPRTLTRGRFLFLLSELMKPCNITVKKLFQSICHKNLILNNFLGGKMTSIRSKSASPTRRLSYDLKSVKINDLVDTFDNIPLLMSKLHAHQANKRRYSILGTELHNDSLTCTLSLTITYSLTDSCFITHNYLLTYLIIRSSTQSVICNGRITNK